MKQHRISQGRHLRHPEPPAPQLGANDPLDGLAAELGKREPFKQLNQAAYISLLRTASRVAEPFDALMAEHNLSQPLFNVLRIVAGHEPDGVTCQLIGEQLISRGPDVTRLVDRLVDRGFVERGPCPDDARRRIIRLTTAGSNLLDHLTPAVNAVHSRQFGDVSDDDLRELLRILQHLRDTEKKDADDNRCNR